MALTTCEECGKDLSTEAKTCPHCGYRPRRTSIVTWAVLILIVAAVGSTLSAKKSADDEWQAKVKAAEVKIAAMTPEQKKAMADEQQRREEQKRKDDAAVQLATAGARLLKKAAKNPDSFKLESALVVEKTGAVCYQYRAQNSFGAIVPGQAVLSANGKRFLTDTDDGFVRSWNAQCGGKTGREYATAIRWMAL